MHKSDRFHRTTFLGLLMLLAMPWASMKAQAVQSSMEQIARESDAVVVGKVAGLSSEWNEARTRIQTRVTISVDQSLKGDASVKSLTVIVPGGEVDGVGEVYSHAPRFLRDEAVVVFAKKNASGFYQVSEGSEGKYSIHKDDISGAMLVSGKKTLGEFTAGVKTAIQSQISK